MRPISASAAGCARNATAPVKKKKTTTGDSTPIPAKERRDTVASAMSTYRKVKEENYTIFRQIEAIMRNVVAEENYSITRTFYQIRKKNYIINCDFIQDVLGPMMRSSKVVRTDADIKVAACAWANAATRAAAEITYGHISEWETSQVTNMEKLFHGHWNGGDANVQSFNDDISRWDTSNVTTMKGMFCGAHAFNGDLSRWDTSNVTTMEYMFCDAHAFNGDLSRWNTSKITTMRSMFNNAHAFNGDLSRWDTSNVTTMECMFKSAEAFNGNLSRWDTSNVTAMRGMFRYASAFTGDISRWVIYKHGIMRGMFDQCPIDVFNKPRTKCY